MWRIRITTYDVNINTYATCDNYICCVDGIPLVILLPTKQDETIQDSVIRYCSIQQKVNEIEVCVK